MMRADEEREHDEKQRRELAAMGVDPTALSGDQPTEAWTRALIMGAAGRRN